MSCVNIRGYCIGEGRPKVIIPIVEPTETAILKKAAEFSTLRADCVEWRIHPPLHPYQNAAAHRTGACPVHSRPQ